MSSDYRRRQIQIAEVMVRYELGHLLEALGLEGLVSTERRVFHRGPGRTRPESLRLALQELGPTFIKLGQVLSTRADLLPPEFQTELAKLQDDAGRISTDIVQETISAELGMRTDEAFDSFDPEPLATASIGQVHAATLHDGTDVVVKVRRPGAAEEVEQDLEILQNLAARAAKRWEQARHCDVSGLAKEFADTMRSELDYLAESRNAQQVAANFADDPEVHIPAVYPDLTTSRVLTLERIRGRKINDLAGLGASGIDRKALAERLTHAVAKMVLEHGLYHADPHPGNLFVEAGGRIAMVDFGRVGRIDERLRSSLSRLLMALIRKDPERLTSALLAVRVSSGPVDRERLGRDLDSLLSRYGSRSVREMAIGSAITDVMELVRTYNLVMPSDLALLFAVIVMDEGLTEELDPQFRFELALTPYVEHHAAEALSPAALARRAERLGMELAEVAAELPGQLRRLLEAAGEGQFALHLRTDELGPLVRRIERLGNRVSASILAAAVIDGLSGMAAHKGPGAGWRRPAFFGGVAALSALGGFIAWRPDRLLRELALASSPVKWRMRMT